MCNGYPRQIGNFYFSHAPGPLPIVVVISVIYPKRPKPSKMLCVGPDVDKPMPVKPSRGPFSQKHLYKQATLQMCQRTAPFPLPIIPFEKDQRRASASLPADTKAHPRLCASQRSFGTPRSGLPTRLVLSRHTCSVRPSRPLA